MIYLVKWIVGMEFLIASNIPIRFGENDASVRDRPFPERASGTVKINIK